eukprot:gene11838-13067_t
MKRALHVVNEYYCDNEEENSKLTGEIEHLVDSLADSVSIKSIEKADGDLTIERLNSMFENKGLYIEALDAPPQSPK